jgi:hypothetical protein
VDVRIGVTYTPKELEVELADDADRDTVLKQVEEAISGEGMFWLTDRRGRTIGVPAAKIAYVEIGSGHEDRRVGFGS